MPALSKPCDEESDDIHFSNSIKVLSNISIAIEMSNPNRLYSLFTTLICQTPVDAGRELTISISPEDRQHPPLAVQEEGRGQWDNR